MLGLGLGLQKSTKLGGFIGLLDLFPNAAAAYSLRKLRAAYSGNAIRVRKEVSAVSSETDIGFLADGSLDTVSLLAFASDADSGDVFVVTWYDQSTNGNYATQGAGANQPKIVSSGAVITEGTSAKPAIEFDGSSSLLTFPTITFGDLSMFTVFAADNNAQDALVVQFAETGSQILTLGLGDNSTRDEISNRYRNNDVFDLSVGDATFSNTDLTLNTAIAIQSTPSVESYIDGANVLDSVNSRGGGSGSSLGARDDGAFYFDGKISEFVGYQSDQSSNRTAIETNINTFYSIY